MFNFNSFIFPYNGRVARYIHHWSYRPSYYMTDNQVANVSQTINQAGGPQTNTSQTSIINNVK